MLSKKQRNLQQSTASSLRLWIAGFAIYLPVATQAGTRDDWLNLIPKTQVRIIGLVFLASLALIIVTTVTLVVKLKSELGNNNLSPEQKLVGSLALGSLTAAVLALFISIFSVGAIVIGIIALRRTYLWDKRVLENMRIYRNISLAAVLVTSAHIILSLVVQSQ